MLRVSATGVGIAGSERGARGAGRPRGADREGDRKVSAERGSGDALSRLEWRLVGPHRGGRVVAVAGHPTDPNVFYFGHCAGGVWKTSDGGRFW